MKGVSVVEYNQRCIKFDLPNGAYLDLLEQVLSSMAKWRQIQKSDNEAAGFLLGYQNNKTGNITLSSLTEPQAMDFRSRFFCIIKDAIHYRQLKNCAINQNYYVGVWHTHPELIPEPSAVDWKDWNETLCKDKSCAYYIVFIILGINAFRIWVGDPTTKKISEVYETNSYDGVYLKGGKCYES